MFPKRTPDVEGEPRQRQMEGVEHRAALQRHARRDHVVRRERVEYVEQPNCCFDEFRIVVQLIGQFHDFWPGNVHSEIHLRIRALERRVEQVRRKVHAPVMVEVRVAGP